jgi:hypothetical protein
MNRRHEIDAIRGVLLLIMAITHLPTRLNAYADQPFGYVSAAEGFVFLSAFLIGSIHAPLLLSRGATYVRTTLWRRVRRLYGFHLGLLAFVFTVVGGAAHVSHSAGLHNYLLFLFQTPGWALVCAPLLLYQPPLLDILPMYIVFLALTPWVLGAAKSRGWGLILTTSLLIWLLAQLQGSALLYEALRFSRLPLPRDAWGAFDWLAWQLIWVAGLWVGARTHTQLDTPAMPARARMRPYLLPVAVAVTGCLLCSRHHLWGLLSSLDINSSLVDKWKLGPLRVVNFAALGVVVHRLVLPVMRLMRVGVLELLGRSSLQVFTAHIPICVLANALVDLGIALPTVPHEAMLLTTMFIVMLFVAWRSNGRRDRSGAAAPGTAGTQPGGRFRARLQKARMAAISSRTMS